MYMRDVAVTAVRRTGYMYSCPPHRLHVHTCYMHMRGYTECNFISWKEFGEHNRVETQVLVVCVCVCVCVYVVERVCEGICSVRSVYKL